MKLKSFLLFSLLAFSTISCNNSEVVTWSAEEQIVKNYEAAFTAAFGTPDKNHEWGFDMPWVKSTTRYAYTNSNMWESEGYNVPQDITEEEISKVLAVFNQKGEASYTSLVNWDCFFVQQVWKGTASYTANNGGTVIGGNQMDWLCALDASGNDDHVNNFNNSNGSIMLMIDSSTKRFGFKSSTDNGHVFYNFRMEEIDGNYYVGFDFEANGQNPNEQVARDYIYNDWIVKICPGKGVTPPSASIRIIAEDLTINSASDFDFNDVVFDIAYTSSTSAIITLQAAGGTLPLTVAGHEVHDEFGVSVTTMVNTGAGPNLDPVSFEVNGIDKSQNGKDIEIVVLKSNHAIPLTAAKGQVPSKVGVPPTFKWCRERVAMSDDYPTFSKWVQNSSAIWY